MNLSFILEYAMNILALIFWPLELLIYIFVKSQTDLIFKITVLKRDKSLKALYSRNLLLFCYAAFRIAILLLDFCSSIDNDLVIIIDLIFVTIFMEWKIFGNFPNLMFCFKFWKIGGFNNAKMLYSCDRYAT